MIHIHAMLRKSVLTCTCKLQALDYLQKSRGIERTKELAQEHVNLAIKAIEALPDSDDEDVLISRRALIDITQRVITRTK
jgi:geranyl diphosphate synthase